MIHSPTILELIEDIEQLSGLSLCLKRFGSAGISLTSLKIPTYYAAHRTSFCDQVKVTRTDACCQCDLREVPHKAFIIRKPFIHRCHAGASELIIPIGAPPAFASVVYLGQFRTDSDQPEELPLFTQEKIRQLLSIGILIQRYFLNEIEQSESLKDSKESRTQQILQILQNHLKQDISLPQLAQKLNLSSSRAGHLVKELTGKTFVELKLELRINAACKLLSRTLFTVETIAEETGFQDTRYFYRVFQKATGVSPGEWRARHQSPMA